MGTPVSPHELEILLEEELPQPEGPLGRTESKSSRAGSKATRTESKGSLRTASKSTRAASKLSSTCEFSFDEEECETPTGQSSSSFLAQADLFSVSRAFRDVGLDVHGWHISEELGFGAVATVHRVTRQCDGREFAAKRMFSSEEEELQRLEDEYELLRSLSHSSIVRAEMFSRGPLGACLCMELCSEGSVSDYVDEHGAFSEPVAVELTLQLLTGVDHLHCCRIVHRDIKPANLLLNGVAAQQLKIGDFGSAQRIGCSASSSALLSDRGTQLYTAPELRFGHLWNERVDIWASGLSSFFMLAAELPFDAANTEAVRMLKAGRLPEVAWDETIGRDSRSLVLQCLTVEMHDRPTAMELILHPAFKGLGHPTGSGMAPFEEALRRLAHSRFVCALEAHTCYF